MTPKRRTIFRLMREGKSYTEIGKTLGINQANLNSTIYQMRKAGIILKRSKELEISPKQRAVLLLYMERVPVPEIAAKLQICCQTVQNHAAEGFKRLGLTTPGVDRIEALKTLLEPRKITMQDPFFN